MRHSSIVPVIIVTLSIAFCTHCFGQVKSAATPTASADVDWSSFLKRHDIVWETLPTRFDHGVWHGNGLLGAMIYKEKDNLVRWELGRSDVTTHRRDNSRLLIGGMGLETVGQIKGGTARLDLWNAESSGTIETSKGTIEFRTFIHSIELITIVELKCSEGEKGAKFKWLPWPCVDARTRGGGYWRPLNPDPSFSRNGNINPHFPFDPIRFGMEFAPTL